MKWNKYTITTTTDAEDLVISMLDDLGIQGAEIQDKQPLTTWEKEQMFVDILPDMPEDDGVAYISFYLDEDADKEAVLVQVKEEIENLRIFCEVGEGSIAESETEDKDWINNWKKYFSQFYVDDILIIPSWENVKVEDQEKMILHIDPGTAFGTGKHETTQLCIRQLKKYVTEDTQLLDVGTGSGILGIVAAKLGAKHVVGTDLDPCAVPAVAENLENNGLGTGQNTEITQAEQLKNSGFELIIGNIIDSKEVQEQVGYEKYDIVVANILAEVLVPLTPVIVGHLKPGGIYITSGIIDMKKELIVETVQKAGLELVEVTQQGEWVSVTARKKDA